MNSALDLIATLERAGATFRVEGDSFVIAADAPLLTPETIEALRAHKSELLDYLRFPTADSYLRLLRTDDVLNGDSLPPIPPAWITDTGEYRAEAWAAWWDSVDAQRRRAKK